MLAGQVRGLKLQEMLRIFRAGLRDDGSPSPRPHVCDKQANSRAKCSKPSKALSEAHSGGLPGRRHQPALESPAFPASATFPQAGVTMCTPHNGDATGVRGRATRVVPGQTCAITRKFYRSHVATGLESIASSSGTGKGPESDAQGPEEKGVG